MLHIEQLRGEEEGVGGGLVVCYESESESKSESKRESKREDGLTSYSQQDLRSCTPDTPTPAPH